MITIIPAFSKAGYDHLKAQGSFNYEVYVEYSGRGGVAAPKSFHLEFRSFVTEF
ncbi:MAG: hypothetical protein KKA84_15360 [Bacteroidetes bacterium]|nr:hypothetical protein [Bacteroidota bacterium]